MQGSPWLSVPASLFDYPCRVTASEHACVRMQSICRHTHHCSKCTDAKHTQAIYINWMHPITQLNAPHHTNMPSPQQPRPSHLLDAVSSLAQILQQSHSLAPHSQIIIPSQQLPKHSPAQLPQQQGLTFLIKSIVVFSFCCYNHLWNQALNYIIHVHCFGRYLLFLLVVSMLFCIARFIYKQQMTILSY
jgi:hypothetical protein